MGDLEGSRITRACHVASRVILLGKLTLIVVQVIAKPMIILKASQTIRKYDSNSLRSPYINLRRPLEKPLPAHTFLLDFLIFIFHEILR